MKLKNNNKLAIVQMQLTLKHKLTGIHNSLIKFQCARVMSWVWSHHLLLY